MMRVLIEQYSYKVTDLPLELRKLERESDGKVSFDRVGYYLDVKVHDCVFILTKGVLWTRDDKGNFVRKMAMIGMHNNVSVGYLPFTQRNILNVAFSCLGDRYARAHKRAV